MQFNQYGIIMSALYGPIVSRGLVGEDLLPYRWHADTLIEAKGAFHENFVNNTQCFAVLEYNPAFMDVTPEPTATYPEQVRWKYRIGTSYTTRLVPFGVAYTGAVARQWAGNDYWSHNAFECPDKQTFIKYEVICPSAKDCYGTATKWLYELDHVDGNYAYYKVTFWSMRSIPDTERAGDWSVKRTWSDIMTTVVNSIDPTPHVNSNLTLIPLRLRWTEPSLVIEDIKLEVDSHIADVLLFPDNPLRETEEVDYGSLALEASQKIPANNVNMLEFLADMKNPSRMIPRLKNLRNIKEYAGNYLAIEYGILPTVDDLKSIFRSCTRLRPKVDSFGSRHVKAGHDCSITVQDVQYQLEQRIKIAFHDEDSGLKILLNRLDDLGALPTLSNLWDLVPYSFVVDWFAQVGDLLERIDMRLQLLRYDIRTVTMSRKDIRSTVFVPTLSCPLAGPATMVRYKRWVTGRCPVPPVFQSSTSTASGHWLEATALIIQRLK